MTEKKAPKNKKQTRQRNHPSNPSLLGHTIQLLEATQDSVGTLSSLHRDLHHLQNRLLETNFFLRWCASLDELTLKVRAPALLTQNGTKDLIFCHFLEKRSSFFLFYLKFPLIGLSYCNFLTHFTTQTFLFSVGSCRRPY